MMDDLDSINVVVGGRPIADPWDRLCRYCGLPWSGGQPETWAYRYYDAVDTAGDDQVSPVDVMVAAALHPGLSRADLGWFHDSTGLLAAWLAGAPPGVALADADETVRGHVAVLAGWETPVSLALLSKVLHRKRPQLVPLLDRDLIDWYRPVTGQRSPAAAWPPLLEVVADDLRRNAAAIELMTDAAAAQLGRRLSAVRILDVVIWMGGQR